MTIKNYIQQTTGKKDLSTFTNEDRVAMNREACDTGAISDDNNPAFLLNNCSTEMLRLIASGEINLQDLAKSLLK